MSIGAWGQKGKEPERIVKMLVTQSCLTLCNSMDCSCQASLSMEFCRQEYWSGLLFPPPADLPNSEIKPASPVFPALAGGFLTRWAIEEAPYSLSPKIFLHIWTSHRDSLNFMPLYLPCNLYPIFHKLLLVFESFPELFLYFMNSLKALVHQTSLRELTGVNIWLRNFKI